MIRTDNSIWIAASPARVFSFAAAVERWPELLPHYRFVRVVQDMGNRRLVEMSARRSGIPTRWTSEQCLIPDERILYTHVAGLTAGMEVEWRLTPRNGGTHITLTHVLAPRRWFLRGPLAAWIVGEFFVKSIADQTLHHLRRHAEARREAYHVGSA